MRTHRSLCFLVSILVVGVVACGKKASTPTQAFNMFYEASKSKDVATLKRLMAKETIKKMEERATRGSTTVDEVIAKETQSGIPEALPATRNEKIDGDKATLEFNYKRGDTDNWRTISLVKEDGEWKVIFQ